MCVVYDWLTSIDGSPVAGAVVRARAVVPNAAEGRAEAIAAVETTTGVDGYFELELVRGAKVAVYAPAAGYAWAPRTTPNAASQQLSTWTTT
jgi:hypothetical protein